MPKNLRHRVRAAAYDDDRVVRNRLVTQAIPLLDAVNVLRRRASVSRSTDNVAQPNSGLGQGCFDGVEGRLRSLAAPRRDC